MAELLSIVSFSCYVALIGKALSPDLLKLVRENSWSDRLFILICAGVAVLAGVVGFRGELALASDSVEYGVAALNWVQQGVYGFAIDGVLHPPRYPFFFSLVLIAPWMVIYPSLKIAVLPIILHLILIPIAAACLGQRCRRTAVTLAPALVLLSPGLLALSGEVLTQIPAVAITLVVWLLYLKSRDGVLKDVAVMAGALIFCASLMRPLSVVLMVPFVLSAWRERHHFQASLPFVTWGLAAVLVHLAYNYWVFGDPGRTGYQYWCSIPYDYFSLTFSRQYLGENLAFLRSTDVPVLLLVFGMVIVDCHWHLRRNTSETANGRRESKSFLSSSSFFVLTGLAPVSVVHLFYFFPNVGFHMPLIACLATLAGAALNAILLPGQLRFSRTALSLSFLSYVAFCSLIIFRSAWLQPASRFHTATRLAEYVSAGDVIISAMDPVYLSAFLPRGVKIVPIGRHVEFASKFAAPRPPSVAIPPTHDWRDNRNPALLAMGATEVVHEVALDSRGQFLLSRPPQGKIWLDADFISKQELAALLRQASFERQGNGNLYLYRNQ